MKVVAALDVTREQLVEPPIQKTIEAQNINPSAGGQNRVFKWPHSQTWTLQPVNVTTDYAATLNWEALKLRLSDFNCNKDYWRESPERTERGNKQGDYFYNYVVPANKLPANYPFHGDDAGADGSNGLVTAASTPPGLVNNYIALNINLILAKQNLQNNSAFALLVSNQAYAANQGFCLRFYLEGRQSKRQGSVLAFRFGEYVVVFHSDGMAQLHITPDFKTYLPVYSFRWADQGSVHSEHHRVIIRPGARNQIEFVCGNETAASPSLVANYSAGVKGGGVKVAYSGGGVFTVPGKLNYDSSANRYLITQAAPIAVYGCSDFRPYLQVGLLAYVPGSRANNTPDNSFLYDSPRNLAFPPSLQFNIGVDYDPNGGSIEYGLYDPDTKGNWQPGKDLIQYQFACTFHGGGAGGSGYCFQSPELYRYSIKKGAKFEIIKRDTVYRWLLSASINRGKNAESERANFTFDNSKGQMEAFVGRTDIPILVYDADTSVILFEGTAIQIGGADNVHAPYSVGMECRGMSGDLIRPHFTENAPDFGHDADDPKGEGQDWREMVYYCFAVSGYDRPRVMIENGDKYAFKIWDTGQNGDAQGNKESPGSKGSDAHVKGDGSPGARWKPKEDSTPSEFLKTLLQDFLHWDFQYSYKDRSWHCFKRPLVENKDEADKFKPKAVYFSDTTRARIYHAAHSDLPVYTYSSASFDSQRPECTSVTVRATMTESTLRSKGELADLMKQAQAGTGNPEESALKTEVKKVPCILTNPQGYPHPANTKGYNNPDWLGHNTFRLENVQASDRNALAWIAKRIFWHLCFGRELYTFKADFGDAFTANYRKWDCVLIDTGRNAQGQRDGSLELWHFMNFEANWTRDTDARANYHWVKYREDCPVPF